MKEHSALKVLPFSLLVAIPLCPRIPSVAMPSQGPILRPMNADCLTALKETLRMWGFWLLPQRNQLLQILCRYLFQFRTSVGTLIPLQRKTVKEKLYVKSSCLTIAPSTSIMGMGQRLFPTS